MPVINLLVVLVVVGVLLWLVNNYIPMDAKIKRILNIVVCPSAPELARQSAMTSTGRKANFASRSPAPTRES